MGEAESDKAQKTQVIYRLYWVDGEARFECLSPTEGNIIKTTANGHLGSNPIENFEDVYLDEESIMKLASRFSQPHPDQPHV